MFPVIDLHVHIAPYHMLRAEARRTFLIGKDNHEQIEGYSSDAPALLRLMDVEQIERIGIMNYISPDVIGPGPEVNEWALELASADPKRLIACPVHRITERRWRCGPSCRGGARALIHPPHEVAVTHTSGRTGWPDSLAAEVGILFFSHRNVRLPGRPQPAGRPGGC
jgi:hypothetical protein